jgi:hypothetical protein
VFVLDVDDYAYKYLVPSVFQAAVGSFPLPDHHDPC